MPCRAPPACSIWRLKLPEGMGMLNGVYGIVMLAGCLMQFLIYLKVWTMLTWRGSLRLRLASLCCCQSVLSTLLLSTGCSGWSPPWR